MLKLTERPKTPGIKSKKIWLSLKKGISCFQVILLLIWIKQTLILFKLQRNGNGNELLNIKDSFAKCLQLQMSFHKGMHLQKYTKVCASSRLVSQVSHTIAEQNIKEKYLYVNPNQNVDTTCNSKLNFTQHKDLFINRVQKKLVKVERWITYVM